MQAEGGDEQEGLEEHSEEMKELALALSWSFRSSTLSEFAMNAEYQYNTVRRIKFPSWT